MKDRVPVNPGRVLITPENGSAAYYATMKRADNPTQEGTPLNKASLLKDATAALFGLGVNAVPDDVFSWLGKYNQHWWKRVPTSWVTSLAEPYDTKDYRIQCAGGKYDARTVSYSSEIVVDANGNVSLAPPVSTVSVSYNKYSNANVLKGKYVDGLVDGNYNIVPGIYYITPETGDAQQSGYYGVSMGTRKVKTTLVDGTTVEYLYSSDANAYPNGVSGGFRYNYMGVPFSNLQLSAKIATGSYMGTGTYGASNPNSLTFDFPPKAVVIVSKALNYKIFALFVNGVNKDGYVGLCQYGSSSSMFTGSFDGNTLSWYCTDSAELQLNMRTYDYFAIG